MRYAVTLLVLIAVTGFATSGFGHPPSEVSARFDTDNQLLTVTVMHGVKDASKHYVGDIEVELNGKKMTEQQFMRQTDVNVQEAVYKIIDAQVGDKIKVTAACNISGKNSAEITIAKKVEKQQAEGGAGATE